MIENEIANKVYSILYIAYSIDGVRMFISDPYQLITADAYKLKDFYSTLSHYIDNYVIFFLIFIRYGNLEKIVKSKY